METAGCRSNMRVVFTDKGLLPLGAMEGRELGLQISKEKLSAGG
jgi:hypothetical protein